MNSYIVHYKKIIKFSNKLAICLVQVAIAIKLCIIKYSHRLNFKVEHKGYSYIANLIQSQASQLVRHL